MFNKINRILYERIIWNPHEIKENIYISTAYSKDECWLEMNDFPDEPLWTLYYNGNKKYLEDTPLFWKINYKNKYTKAI